MITRTLSIVFAACLAIACGEQKSEPINFPPTDLGAAALIPRPLDISATGEAFGLDQYSAIITEEGEEGFNRAGSFLAEKISGKTGLHLQLNPGEDGRGERNIYILKAADTTWQGQEAYCSRRPPLKVHSAGFRRFASLFPTVPLIPWPPSRCGPSPQVRSKTGRTSPTGVPCSMFRAISSAWMM